MRIAEIEDGGCVGCETCHHCGRDKNFWMMHIYCDICGNDVESAYFIDDKDVCEGCVGAVFESVNVEDLDVQDYV